MNSTSYAQNVSEKTVAQVLRERTRKVNDEKNKNLADEYKMRMEKEVNEGIATALEEIEKAVNQGLYSIEIFSAYHCELMDRIKNDERFSGLTLIDVSDVYQEDGFGCVKISWE
jgi:trans-2-enoyl-CoA reductase